MSDWSYSPPAPHTDTVMDLISPVTHAPDSYCPDLFSPSLNFALSLPACLSVYFPSSILSLFPRSPLCDDHENMLTCNPSVPLIKTFVVMSTAPGVVRQGHVSVVLSWGMANRCHGLAESLAWLLHWLWATHSTLLWVMLRRSWPEMGLDRCAVWQVGGIFQGNIVHVYLWVSSCSC